MMAYHKFDKNILNKINKIYNVQEQHVNDGLPVTLHSLSTLSYFSSLSLFSHSLTLNLHEP